MKKAFTLIEMMVAITIVVLGFTVILSMALAAMSNAETSKSKTKATAFANGILEKFRIERDSRGIANFLTLAPTFGQPQTLDGVRYQPTMAVYYLDPNSSIVETNVCWTYKTPMNVRAYVFLPNRNPRFATVGPPYTTPAWFATPTLTSTPTVTPTSTTTPIVTSTPTRTPTPTITPTPTGSGDLIWYSTLNNSAAVTTPAVGTAGTVNSAQFVAGYTDNALRARSNSQYISIPTTGGNFNAAVGTIEFWYKPAHVSTDDAAHVFFDGWKDDNNTFFFEKNGDNELQFTIQQGMTSISKSVTSANYSWSAGDWVFLRVEWNNSIPSPYTNQLRIFVNGAEPANYFDHDDFSSSTYIGTRLYVPGTWATAGADGIIDEFKIYNRAL